MPDARAPICRARPVMGLLGAPTFVATADGHWQTLARARHLESDGTPLAAVWVPVAPLPHAPTGWGHLGADGVVRALPAPADCDATGLTLLKTEADAAPATDADVAQDADAPSRPQLTGWIDLPRLPWPQRGQQGLLVLLHDQTAGTGEGLYPLGLGAQALAAFLAARLPDLLSSMFADLQAGQLRWDPLMAIHTAPPHAADDGHRQVGADDPHAPWVLAIGCCAYPYQVFDGSARGSLLRRPDDAGVGPADRSLMRLAQRCLADVGDQSAPDPAWRPQAVLFTGDQVYVDATAGLFDPAVLDEALRFAYQRLHDSIGWERLRLAAGPHAMLFDDHELRDNWAMGRNTAHDDSDLTLAQAAYQQGQRQPYWPLPLPDPQADGSLDAALMLAGRPLFALDVRTHRERRTAHTLHAARIMSSDQEGRLRDWLQQHAGPGRAPCFIASSSMLLPRRLATTVEAAQAMYEDAWSGYPASRDDLLVALWQAQANNVILLSGDEHLGSVTTITLHHPAHPERDVQLVSVHAPALYAPYPFANADASDFAAEDAFSITRAADHPNAAASGLMVTVRTWFASTGDGFAMLRLTPQDETHWQVAVRMDLAQAAEDWPG